MTKQEFLRFLKMEAEEEQELKKEYQELYRVVEHELSLYPASIEIETGKGLKDVWEKMCDHAKSNAKKCKDGTCFSYSNDDGLVQGFIKDLFNLKDIETAKAVNCEEIDIDDLLA